MNDIIYTLEYKDFVNSIIQKIQNAQYESLKLVNKNLIQLYWDIGKEICERQKRYGWGKSIVEDLALELRETFSGRTGFSARNLWRMRNFFVTFEENGDGCKDNCVFLLSRLVRALDLFSAVTEKMNKNNGKYPKELCKGKRDKYTAYLE